jgi:CRP-like cAMP-binding protein
MMRTSNLFLSGLSPESRSTLLSRCTALELPLHSTLYEAEFAPGHAYFLTAGLASVVTPMSRGEAVEVGFIGDEGIVGSLHLLGSAPPSTQCMMQLAGSGLKISFAALQSAFDSSEEIRKRILEFLQEQAITVGQIAGCNRLHSAEKRLIRWLLMAQDRTHTDVLTFTHEYLAGMIGTRRTTVTILASDLQARSLISYRRGTIRIVNREGLESMACDCYQIIKSLYTNLYRRDGRPPNTNGTRSSSSSGSVAEASPLSQILLSTGEPRSRHDSRRGIQT